MRAALPNATTQRTKLCLSVSVRKREKVKRMEKKQGQEQEKRQGQQQEQEASCVCLVWGARRRLSVHLSGLFRVLLSFFLCLFHPAGSSMKNVYKLQ